MLQLEQWPPPDDWVEIVVSWNTMLQYADYNPNAVVQWCRDYPGHSRWHLHGWNGTLGFAFRFEDPRDATAFSLRWAV